jgi:hypothetical protein
MLLLQRSGLRLGDCCVALALAVLALAAAASGIVTTTATGNAGVTEETDLPPHSSQHHMPVDARSKCQAVFTQPPLTSSDGRGLPLLYTAVLELRGGWDLSLGPSHTVHALYAAWYLGDSVHDAATTFCRAVRGCVDLGHMTDSEAACAAAVAPELLGRASQFLLAYQKWGMEGAWLCVLAIASSC